MTSSAFTPTILQDFREASVSQSGIVNTTAQTFLGIKTYDPSVAFTPKSGFSSGYQLWKDTSSRLRLNFSGGLLFADDTDATTYLSCGSSGQWTIGNAADTSFPGNNIVGRKDGSTVGAGYVGQYLTALSSTKTPNVQDAWHDFTGNSITLTPGNWELTGAISFDHAGSSGDYFVCWGAYSTVAGNNTPTVPTLLTTTFGLNNMQLVQATAMAKRFITMPTVRQNVTSNTTVYLNASSNQTNGAVCRVTCYFMARRII